MDILLSVFLIEKKPEETNPDDDDTTTDPNEPDDGDDTGTNPDEPDNNTGEETGDGAGDHPGNTSGEDPMSGIMTSVSVTGMGYNLDLESAIYVLGPSGATVLLDGVELGTAPMDFEKIIGSYIITIIRSDGAVKNFNCTETDNGKDSYYNFSWID